MSYIDDLNEKIQRARVLLVGAGGIGCEVLKNLTLSGFKNIDAIDLDTIDVSNLNRQFLFNKTNVGRSKAEVAIEMVKKNYSTTNEGLNLNAMHKSIMLSEFDKDFFQSYNMVINALDNRAARSHVNRMCIAAGTPLLESGTEGYLGQTSFIKKSLTACYECEGLQKDGKTYATCTIRNTPSKPIHCIVWAKHLFHQLFGESDPDNDVSPEVEASKADEQAEIKIHLIEDPEKLLEKLYRTDINYLLSMENLWKERTKPSLLNLDEIRNSDQTANHEQCDVTSSIQSLWSLQVCVEKFIYTFGILRKRMEKVGHLDWDKDDQIAMDFVTAASNLRSENFHIERKSPFETKSLAGNIVPAISSTNSIIAGLLVLQALRLLKSMPFLDEYKLLSEEDKNKVLKDVGRLTYLKKNAINNNTIIASYGSFEPQPDCLSCSKDTIPEYKVYLNFNETTLGSLIDKIVIDTFHFVCPDICIYDGSDSGTILWSQDDIDENSLIIKSKKLIDLPRINQTKTSLTIYDLIQDKTLRIILINESVDSDKHQSFFHLEKN